MLSSSECEVNSLQTAFSYHHHIVHVIEDKAGEAKVGEMAYAMGKLTMSTAFSGIDTPAIGGYLLMGPRFRSAPPHSDSAKVGLSGSGVNVFGHH
jgi:hypothetical protein